MLQSFNRHWTTSRETRLQPYERTPLWQTARERKTKWYAKRKRKRYVSRSFAWTRCPVIRDTFHVIWPRAIYSTRPITRRRISDRGTPRLRDTLVPHDTVSLQQIHHFCLSRLVSGRPNVLVKKLLEEQSRGENNERDEEANLFLSFDAFTFLTFVWQTSNGTKSVVAGVLPDQCLHSVRQGPSWMVLKNMRLAPYNPRIRARTSTNRDLLPGPVPNMAQTMPRYAYSFEEPRGGAAVVLGKAWTPWPVVWDSSRRACVWRSWRNDEAFEVPF